eukprot:TRINITY_DN533_c0_g1_i11.p1 TRINITY_DN533_c0_g1~~TRINITY_DN533_c0_g1_i11.p1  ORF type:complete len:338 (-),score=78.28 TRINITY_DN533_c0_g1_i11:130-1143(-)
MKEKEEKKKGRTQTYVNSFADRESDENGGGHYATDIGIELKTSKDIKQNSSSINHIDVASVQLGKKIGEGSFGTVFRGEWTGTKVAVKQIKLDGTVGGDMDKARAEFEQELTLTAKLQNHSNVVAFFGTTTLDSGDLAIIVEFCNKGSLVDALYGKKPMDLSPQQQLSISQGTAAGVEHLHQQGIIHRDLAARNVLLSGSSSRLVPKVADFGMAREMDDEVYEQQTKQEVGPVRWMAPEQMEKHVYSEASDVFAFGVVLYEIWAREMPWKGVKNLKVAMNMALGERMTPPSTAPKVVQQLMIECWHKQPSKRPAMSDVQQRLFDEMDDSEYEESSTS